MRFFFISLCLFGCIALNAQQPTNWTTRDVIHPELLKARLIANKKSIQDKVPGSKSFTTTYIPLKFHLVAKEDGNGRIDASLVINTLCNLNEMFSDLGIVFYIKDGFNNLDHTPTYENPKGGSAVGRMISVMVPNAVNIFITQNADTNGNQNGTTLGFYNGQTDFVVVRKSELVDRAYVLSHELGHYFSLNHPHYGWEDDPWTEEMFGKKVTVTKVSSSQTAFINIDVELMDKSNCNVAGDMVCDTPPDYNFGALWPNSCPDFNVEVFDRNGDTIRPMTNNVMSYFVGCEPHVFTQNQSDLIRADYNSAKRASIRSSFVPDTTKLEGILELTGPGFNETVPFFNQIALEWTPIEHAQTYYILIKGGNEEYRLYTDQTTLEITNLSPNKTYTWSVHPFTLTGGCFDKQTSLFKTNDTSTAIHDPEFASGIQLFPNPIQSQDILQLTFSSTLRTEGKIQVMDMSGKIHFRQVVHVTSGRNTIKIDIPNLEKGIYLSSLITKKGILTRSFVKL